MASNLLTPLMGPASISIGNCSWRYTYDNIERNYYHQGLVVTSIFSEILTLWLNFSLIMTTLWNDENYSNFALFTLTVCARRLAWGLGILPSLRNDSTIESCISSAEHDCFFSVLELEGLTHVCIARYVMSRYAANKWSMDIPFNYIYMFSTAMFAIVYTMLPVSGFGGSFAYDFSCTTCSVDMLLPNNYQRFIVLTLFFMRSVKPVVVMTSALTRASYLDNNVCTDPKAADRKAFTRTVMAVTAVTLLCWFPLGAIRGYVIIGQLFYDQTEIITSMVGLGETINWAMFLYWASPCFMVITAMLVDGKIRHNMIYVYSESNRASEIANREAEKAERERMNNMEKKKGKKTQ